MVVSCFFPFIIKSTKFISTETFSVVFNSFEVDSVYSLLISKSSVFSSVFDKNVENSSVSSWGTLVDAIGAKSLFSSAFSFINGVVSFCNRCEFNNSLILDSFLRGEVPKFLETVIIDEVTIFLK